VAPNCFPPELVTEMGLVRHEVARHGGRVAFLCSASLVFEMAPKRLRQATFKLSASDAGTSRPVKLSRSASPASSALWLRDLPEGLMVYCPTTWVGSQSTGAPLNEPLVQGTPVGIAAFDLDSTIITTKSGSKFPRSAGDWKLISPRILIKLQQVHACGMKVVVFTNQGGVATGRIDISFLHTRCEAIATALAIPVAFYIATAKNQFRKPSSRMWDVCIDHLGGSNMVDMTQSFYVGDAAGRPPSSRKQRDFSDSDRKFALNVGVSFYTPEMYFDGSTESVESLPLSGLDPRTLLTSEHIVGTADCNSILRRIVSPGDVAEYLISIRDKPRSQTLVLLVGFPASGKTTFARRHLISHGFEWINQDNLKTAAKCLKTARDHLAVGRSVVVDMTNPKATTRAAYTELARNCGKPVCVVALVMQTSREIAEHLNIIRERSEDGVTNEPVRTRVPAVAFNTFAKSLVLPSLPEEEIDKIGFVEFFPHFDSEAHLKTFRQFS
jgi:bifunctional polynucleotide phosphatase/kinase